MSDIVLVTGGARSGKSALAERLARRSSQDAVYIATAEAHDAEMKERIRAHKARRGDGWTTVQEPLDLVCALTQTDTAPRLVDCLTLWLSNLMHAERDVENEAKALVACLAVQTHPVVLVTNEVGSGIVPANELARRYRDAAGWLNQSVADIADEVFLSVSGCPVRIKPSDAFF